MKHGQNRFEGFRWNGPGPIVSFSIIKPPPSPPSPLPKFPESFHNSVKSPEPGPSLPPPFPPPISMICKWGGWAGLLPGWLPPRSDLSECNWSRDAECMQMREAGAGCSVAISAAWMTPGMGRMTPGVSHASPAPLFSDAAVPTHLMAPIPTCPSPAERGHPPSALNAPLAPSIRVHFSPAPFHHFPAPFLHFPDQDGRHFIFWQMNFVETGLLFFDRFIVLLMDLSLNRIHCRWPAAIQWEWMSIWTWLKRKCSKWTLLNQWPTEIWWGQNLG